MEEIFKVVLSIWIMLTIVTIIPNVLTVIKIIKGKVKTERDLSLPEFVCAYVWTMFTLIMGSMVIYKFL